MPRRDASSRLPKYQWRGARIFGYGLALTALTWFIDSEQYIRFGILHLIGLSIFLAYPFLRYKTRNVAIGLGVIVAGMVIAQYQNALSSPWLLWLGFRPESLTSFDYRPLLPWFGVVLLGIGVGNWLYVGNRRRFTLPDLSGVRGMPTLALLGRWSLFIYLIQQPVLVPVLTILGVIEPSTVLG